MTNKQRLKKLKKLQITKRDNPPFNSQGKCFEWIDKVMPLLRFNEEYYKTFFANSLVVNFGPFLAENSIPCQNKMIDIVDQAITELENETRSNININTNQYWYQKPLGLIGIGVLIIVLGAITLWIIKYYLSINL